jgi:hypothetical protein
MIQDNNTPLPANTALASVTDVAINALDPRIIWVGLGNVGQVAPSRSGGVWKSTNGGMTWQSIVGGHDPKQAQPGNPGAVVLRQFLPPRLNSPQGSQDGDGTIVGKVLIALPSENTGEDVAYVFIANPTTQGSITDGGSQGLTANDNRFGLYKTRNGGLSWTHVMLREQQDVFLPADGDKANFVDIAMMGNEAQNVGALVVDPGDSNIVYIGGSNRYMDRTSTQFPSLSGDRITQSPAHGSNYPDTETWNGDPDPSHGFIRVDTSNMRDTEYLSPYFAVQTYPNDGDSILRVGLSVENETTAPLKEYGPYPSGSGYGNYEGEGVFWYDLATTDSGQFWVSGHNDRYQLPAVIHSLEFDPHGRLLVGTEGGVFRGTLQGFSYDDTAAGYGIAALEGLATPREPGMIWADLNGNLQIADQTSIAQDPANRDIVHITASNLGFARLDPTSGQWESTNTSSLGRNITSFTYISNDLFANQAPFNAGSVRVGDFIQPPTPGVRDSALPFTSTDSVVYRTHSLRVDSDPTQPATFGQIERSLQGGAPGTFVPITTGINITGIIDPLYQPLAVTQTKQPINVNGTTVFDDSMLFYADQLYRASNGSNPAGVVWNAVPGTKFLNQGELVTSLSFGATGDVYFVGTSQGRILSTTNNGATFNGPVTVGNAKVNDIVGDPNNPLVAYAMLDGFSGNHVLITTDGGATWTDISNNLPNVPAYAMAIDRRLNPKNPALPFDPTAPQGRLYVGTQTGAFVSTDNGNTWQRLGIGLPNVPVTDISFNPDFEELVVATQGAGAFKLSTNRVGPHLQLANPNLPAGSPALQPNPGNVPVGPNTSTNGGADPVYTASPGMDSMVITFNEPVDPRTFTLDQVKSLTGPNGPIVPQSVTLDNADVLPGQQYTRYLVTFPRQTSDGIYQLTLGTGIRDFTGNFVDANQNRVQGEVPGDQIMVSMVINTTDDGRYLSGNYHDLLGGRADANGFINLLGSVDEARLQALSSESLSRIITSDLARGNLIAGFYNINDNSSGFSGVSSWMRASDTLFIGNFLGRTASDSEVQNWVNRLKAGATINDVISAIVSSDEYYNKNGANDPGFLTQLYVDILGRPFDQTGFTNWSNSLAASEAQARQNVASVFTSSREYHEKEVTADFLKYLGRSPSTDDVRNYANALDAGRTHEQQIAILMGSQEYFNRAGGTNQGWLTAAYRDVFGRPLDPAGQSTFLPQLNAGVSREVVAGQLLASPEYQSGVVRLVFQQFLGRQPTAAELSTYTGFLQQGDRSETIINRVVALQEYFDANKGTATDRPTQDSNWVASLYQNVLGRVATAAEIAGHSQVLQSQEAAARGNVVQAFVSSAEFVNREVQVVYSKDLLRGASPGEVVLWTPLLQQGSAGPGQPSPVETFLSGVVGSSEYLMLQPDANGQTHSNLSWANAVYRDVLGIANASAVDPTGRDALFSAVVSDYESQRRDVSTAMDTSTEYRTRLVTGFYQTYLRRMGTPAEIAAGVQRLALGARDEEIIRDLVASLEYFQSPALGRSDNSAWLNQVYHDLLGRNTDAGAQGFLNFLNSPPTSDPNVMFLRRQTVAQAILTSPEYRNRLINQFYTTYLGRAASPTEQNNWRMSLERGATDEQIIARLLSSTEYFMRPHQFP